MVSAAALAALGPLIESICNVSGIPGVSLGVLHHGKVIHTASFGFADVKNRIPCNADTTFLTGHLSYAMTGAIMSSMAADGLLSSWETPLSTIFPEFNRTDIYGTTTLLDLLSHRSGLASLDSLWHASNNTPFLPRSEAVSVLNSAPGATPFRSHWNPNNFGYEVLGQVIEELTDAPFSENLAKRLTEPLGMNRTYYLGSSADNEALPYAALSNGSFVRVSPPPRSDHVLMASASGIRSSVNDLLKLYAAFMGAAHKEMEWDINPRNVSDAVPIAYATDLMQSYVGLPGRDLNERSYGLGWARSQLPGTLGLAYIGLRQLNPIVGARAPSRLAVFHSGLLPGFGTFAAMFPETNSAVAVLTNGLARSDGPRWIAELLIETLFDNQRHALNYTMVAQVQAERWSRRFEYLEQNLAANRTVTEPRLPLDAYVGRYWNRFHNFFIDIAREAGSGALQVSFMGRQADTFALTPYKNGSFYWTLTQDESARLARMTNYFSKDHYVLGFKSEDSGARITGLWWKHDVSIPRPGEFFQKESLV